MSLTNINADGQSFYNYEGSLISSKDAGGYILDEDFIQDIPGSTGNTFEIDTNSAYTDSWGKIFDWIYNKTGLNYILKILTAVPDFLKIMDMPTEIIFALSALWYIWAVLSVVMFLRGD